MKTGAAKERSSSASTPRTPKNRIRGLRAVRRPRVKAKSSVSYGPRWQNRCAYGANAAGGCRTRTHTVNAVPVYQITLGYDNVGRISTKTEVVSGTSHVFDYTYDLDGQLFEVRKDGNLVEQYG